MSRGAGYLDQVVELDFQYPSEGIHKRWDAGYRITALAATPDQVRSRRAAGASVLRGRGRRGMSRVQGPGLR
jgi:hypothetical protein